jgi:hypothetical protein
MSEAHFGGQDSGHGPAELVVQAWKMYRRSAPLLVPAFLIGFLVLRELLLVVLIIDLPPIPLLLVVTLVQAVIPAFAGSVLLAPAVSILATDGKRRLKETWNGLAEVHPHIYRTAACSAGLALFAAITLGPVGVIVQPMLLGPPLLIHEVALQRRSLEDAWEHTKEMISHDSRPLILMLVVPAAIGLLLSVTLRAFGILSGDVPGVARGVVYFAIQGAMMGAAFPFVAAVTLLCYRDLASTLGEDDAS